MNIDNEKLLRIELKTALAEALEYACKDTDLKTLDWFSYNPDFYIQSKEKIAV